LSWVGHRDVQVTCRSKQHIVTATVAYVPLCNQGQLAIRQGAAGIACRDGKARHAIVWSSAVGGLSVEVITDEKQTIGGVPRMECQRKQTGDRSHQHLPGQ